jgi:hypothetical protein
LKRKYDDSDDVSEYDDLERYGLRDRRTNPVVSYFPDNSDSDEEPTKKKPRVTKSKQKSKLKQKYDDEDEDDDEGDDDPPFTAPTIKRGSTLAGREGGWTLAGQRLANAAAVAEFADKFRPAAVQRTDLSWPKMKEDVWTAPPPKCNTHLNDLGQVDANGLWSWYGGKMNRGWFRRKDKDNEKERARYAANRESEKARVAARERLVEKETGERRESRGEKWDDEALKEILAQQTVMPIIMPGDKVPPSRDEALMVERRDGVTTRLMEVMGGPCRASEMEHDGKHSIACESLLTACNEGEEYYLCDLEYGADGETDRFELITEAALTRNNWNGVRLWKKVWINGGDPLTDDQRRDMIATIRTVCQGKLVIGWGSPELAVFAMAGRHDGIDAMQAVLKRMPHLRNSKTNGVKIGEDKHKHGKGSDKSERDPTKRFSMAMDFLTNLFGIGDRARHTALADCDGEAIVISAFIRFIAKWDRQFG